MLRWRTGRGIPRGFFTNGACWILRVERWCTCRRDLRRLRVRCSLVVARAILPIKSHDPANVPFVILGTGMLWFGWFGFNAGSAMGASGTAVLAFATTNTASAAAMLAWIFFDWMRGNKPSALGACIGAVVGLVAITPAAGYVTIRESIVIGLIASVVSNLAVHWKTKSTLDDTLDVFPCHGVGGMTGMVLTGVFANGGLTSGKFGLFFFHLLALVIVAVFAFGGSWILYKITDWVIPLRVSTEQETLGLDLSQHGESAQGLYILNGGNHTNGEANGAALHPGARRRSRDVVILLFLFDAGAALLVLFDDLLLDVGGYWVVGLEIHGERTLATGHALELTGISEHFRKGDFRPDHLLVSRERIHTGDVAAAGREVGRDVAEFFGGDGYLDRDDWLQQGGPGLFRTPCGTLLRRRF